MQRRLPHGEQHRGSQNGNSDGENQGLGGPERERREAKPRSRPRFSPAPFKPSKLSPLERICLDDHPRIFVPRDMVREVGDANAALLLAQIWRFNRLADRSPSRRSFAVDVDGVLWLRLPRDVLSRRTGLSMNKIKLATRKLVQGHHLLRLGRSQLLRPTKNPEPSTEASNQDLPSNGEEPRRPCRGVRVYAGLVRMAGNAAGALVLGQLIYWHSDGPKDRTLLSQYRDGHWWLAKRYDDLADEIGLKPREVRSAIDRLRSRGIIVTSTHRFAGLNTLFLRFDDAGFQIAWQAQDEAWWELQG